METQTEAVDASEEVRPDADGAAPVRRQRPSFLTFEAYALVLAWIAVLVLFSVLKPETFATSSNFSTIFGSQAVLIVLALGVLIPLTTGDFDLSIASTLGISSIVTAVLTAQHGWSPVAAIVAALAAALLIGLLNGALVAWVGLDSFIVTLGTGTLLAGMAQWISNSNIVSGVPQVMSDWTIGNTFLGVAVDFWYGVAATAILWYVLEFTPLGRRLLFVGRSRGVAQLSGLSVLRLRWGALVASALVAGIAGVISAGELGAADPSSGATFLLPAFAAAFLGATAILPGRFNAPGTFVAVYFLVSGITGLQQLGAASFVQQLFYGGALVIAVGLSHVARNRRARARARRSAA